MAWSRAMFIQPRPLAGSVSSHPAQENSRRTVSLSNSKSKRASISACTKPNRSRPARSPRISMRAGPCPSIQSPIRACWSCARCPWHLGSVASLWLVALVPDLKWVQELSPADTRLAGCLWAGVTLAIPAFQAMRQRTCRICAVPVSAPAPDWRRDFDVSMLLVALQKAIACRWVYMRQAACWAESVM